MTTVDASAIVNRCSAKIPFELETPISNEEVVIDPAAEHAEAAAFWQIDPTLAARCSGVHSATAASNAPTGVIVCCAGRPLNSRLSGCTLATSQARIAKSRRLSRRRSLDTAM